MFLFNWYKGDLLKLSSGVLAENNPVGWLRYSLSFSQSRNLCNMDIRYWSTWVICELLLEGTQAVKGWHNGQN